MPGGVSSSSSKKNMNASASQGSSGDDAGRYVRASTSPSHVRASTSGDVKLRGQLKRARHLSAEAQSAAFQVDAWLATGASGSLETETPTEQTWRIKQDEIANAVPISQTAKANFKLVLPELGPYRANFTHDGTHLLLTGKLGHVALIKWTLAAPPVCELQLRETVRDACMLHNERYFAVAQKEYAFIYDNRGIELHRLNHHVAPSALAFLRNHFLLASSGPRGSLVYQDTSTGAVVAQHRSELGPSPLLAHNPWNAVLAMGHNGGAVTMWTPNLSTPAATVFCHPSPVRCVAFDNDGKYMATSSTDGQVKVWDVRKLTPMHAYAVPAPPTSLAISQRGMLAVTFSRRVQVWNDALSTKASAPYMNHTVEAGRVENLAFCPYEDVLGVGHAAGYSNMLVPGCGEPNYDAFVDNPNATKRQRREAEVHQLLDKLSPEMITLDPDAVCAVRPDAAEFAAENMRRREELEKDRKAQQKEKDDAKTKMKGKKKPTRRWRKKQLNVVDEKKVLRRQEQRRAREAEESKAAVDVPMALRRLV